jgi:hypothetical protein
MHFSKSSTVLWLLTLAIGLAINGYSQPFLTDGLVAYYPFSGNANDVTGNGNNGTAYNATLTTDRFDNTNQAYAFNGTNAYIQVGDLPDLRITNSLTMSAWINPTGSNVTQMIVAKDAAYLFALYGGKPGCELLKGDFTFLGGVFRLP